MLIKHPPTEHNGAIDHLVSSLKKPCVSSHSSNKREDVNRLPGREDGSLDIPPSIMKDVYEELGLRHPDRFEDHLCPVLSLSFSPFSISKRYRAILYNLSDSYFIVTDVPSPQSNGDQP